MADADRNRAFQAARGIVGWFLGPAIVSPQGIEMQLVDKIAAAINDEAEPLRSALAAAVAWLDGELLAPAGVKIVHTPDECKPTCWYHTAKELLR